MDSLVSKESIINTPPVQVQRGFFIGGNYNVKFSKTRQNRKD